MKRRKKINGRLSDKEKLLDNFKLAEERRERQIENRILNEVYKEVDKLLQFKEIVNDAYERYKNKSWIMPFI